MALNATATEAAVKATVKAHYATAFDDGNFSDPPTADEIADAMADLIAKVVIDIIADIKSSADVTGVTAGAATVTGGVD